MQSGIRGIAGFSAAYAIYLHQKTDWSPRRPEEKAGPGYNPNAEPKFLERGFTDRDQVAMMKKAIGSSYKI